MSITPQVAGTASDGFLALLASLRTSHEVLVTEMENMESLTREATPEDSRLPGMRWRLSQASLARRTLSARICDHIQPVVEALELAEIKQLQVADRAWARESAAHIAHWSARSIQQDWEDYCRASRRIRWKMRGHLKMEQRLLFPILERLARRAI
jgi:hypothetical protein